MCCSQALVNFLEEDSLMVSGSIAYHSLLAIFPLLLLLLGMSGLYIRHFELAGHLSVVLQRYLPVRTDIIMQNLVGISRAYGRIGLLSFLLLLWSSSGVFVPLEKALNRAWEVTEDRAVVEKPSDGFGNGFHGGLPDPDCRGVCGRGDPLSTAAGSPAGPIPAFAGAYSFITCSPPSVPSPWRC